MNLGNFSFEYNHLRKHGGLNYETPFDKLQKVTELVSYYNTSYISNPRTGDVQICSAGMFSGL
jgi:hypothetical protein